MTRFPHVTHPWWGIRFLPAVLAYTLLCVPSCAVAEPSEGTAVAVNRAKIEEGVKRLEKNKSLADDERAKTLALYQDAQKELAAAEAWKRKADQYESMRQAAADELARVRKELDVPPEKIAPINAKATPLEQLKEQHVATKVQDDTYREELATLEKEIARRTARQQEVPVELDTARKEISQLEAETLAPPSREEPDVVTARRTKRQAHLQNLNEEIKALTKELPAYEAQNELLLAQKKLLRRKHKTAARQLNALKKAMDFEQNLQAVATVSEAVRVAKTVHPALESLARGNVTLAEKLAGDTGVSTRLRRLNDTVQTIEAHLADVHAWTGTLKEQENIIGLTEAMGVLLRRYHAILPSPAQIREDIAVIHPPVDKVQMNLLAWKDQQEDMDDIPAQARELAQQNGANLPAEKQEELARQASRLLEARRELLDGLVRDTGEYLDKLLVIEVQLSMLQNETKLLRDYIEERILWTRTTLLGVSSWPSIREEFDTLTSAKHWRDVFRVLLHDLRTNPVGYGFLAAVILSLLATQKYMRRGIERTGRGDSNRKGDAFRQTLLALLLTLLLATPVPLLLWVLSWRLDAASTELMFSDAVASALYITGIILAVVFVQLNVCRRRGLAEVHFRWSPEINALLRRRLRLLAAVILPLVFLVVLANQQNQLMEISSLGRLLLILTLAVVAAFDAVVFRPEGPLGKHWYRAREGMLFRLRYPWYAVTVLMPAALVVLTWVGYYSLALRMTWNMTITSWFIVALLLFNGLMLRWLTLLFYTLTTRRRRRRSSPEQDATMDVDVTSLREQSRRVLRFVTGAVLILGLWIIWSDSLPTLRLLGRAPLWETSTTVTLGDAVVAVLVLVLTFLAARGGPGILRMLILDRLSMDKGAKYAVTVLVRYAVGVVGAVVFLSLIGLQWNSIQWLVAAMTVGLGFGLQEIFANFVSGLIILFERPIRVGDTVTVGDTVGTVSKLRIRATTITDWDCRELIVPNREFVTNRLVNWTLSDKILRAILRVGIAYGSDTEKAERLLREAAAAHPLVLKSPSPVVFFCSFGDNSLNFELRVYLHGIENYMKVQHEMNMAIDKIFREHNISIAFPQRDTHLETTRPLDIRILPVEEKPRSKPRK